MVPIVSSVAQAKAVLDAAKYWPDGTRGVALGLAHERFAMRSEGLLPRFAEQNARTVIILQVEDPQRRGGGRRDRRPARRRHAVARPQRPLGGDEQARRVRRCRLRQGRDRDHCGGEKAPANPSAGSPSTRRQAAQFVTLGYDFVSIAGDVWLLQQAFAAGVATVRRGA